MRIAKLRRNQSSGAGIEIEAPRILSFGYSAPELTCKHQALVGVGFNVTSLSEFSAVKSAINKQGRQFRFLLVGPVVPPAQRAAVAELFRGCNSRGVVIFFYRGSISNAEQATAVLSERGSPRNLIDAIQALLGRGDDSGQAFRAGPTGRLQ